jgi:hypothetical protein
VAAIAISLIAVGDVSARITGVQTSFWQDGTGRMPAALCSCEKNGRSAIANSYHIVARRIVRVAFSLVRIALAPARMQAMRCGLPFWADCRYGRDARGIDRRANTSLVFTIVGT